MDYYSLRQKAFMVMDDTLRNCVNLPIDGLVMKVENSCGLTEKFVRERLQKMATMNLIILDKQKDEVSWND